MKAILVGHCNYDGPRLAEIVESAGMQAIQVDTLNQAKPLLKESPSSLVLLNRVFDKTGEEAIPMISKLKQEFPSAKIMLVSNYEDSQEQAEKEGAIKGFGKAMSDEEILAKLKNFL